MPTETKLPLTAAQVLQDIKAEISQPLPVQSAIIGSIAYVRQMQQQFQAAPVIGQLTALKKMIYRLNNSTFSQQYNINNALLNLIEALYHEFDQYRTAQNQQLLEWQYQLDSGLHAPATNNSPLAPPTQAFPAPPEGTKLLSLTQIYTAPTAMSMPERVMLYSLIYGLSPRCYLEIGTFQGGAAVIVCGAMDDTGYGQLICVDPHPSLADDTWQQIHHRTTLVVGHSPAILPKATEAAAEKFDFVLINGERSYDEVLKDIEGVLSLLADETHLLFYDCHYFEIKEAIDTVLKTYPELSDCGLMSIGQTPQERFINGRQVVKGGLRLLKFQRRAS